MIMINIDLKNIEILPLGISDSSSGEGGNSFSVIGYTAIPDFIQAGIDYSKTIYDNWDASITSCKDKYKGDTQLMYFPLVDTSNVKYMNNMFSGCTNLQFVPTIDVSNVTNMQYMFYNCKSLISLDLSSFDTSNVTNMYGMFSYCSNLTSLDLSNFNTSNVTSMGNMFSYDYTLSSIIFGDNFDTSNVTNMSDMFCQCNKLISLDLSSFDTSNVTNMQYMFQGCSKLQRIDGYLDWSKITSYPASFYSGSYSEGYCLRYMTIKNLGKTGTTFSFTSSELQNWGDETNTTTYPLSVGARQSLVDSLLTYSYDRAANGKSSCTIKLYSTITARLTENEIAAITAKGFTIA